MIIALSQFAVKNGMEAEVRAAFESRPRRVESIPGFLGLEVFQDESRFVLLTRWTDEASFNAWHHGPGHHESHALIPPGLKLDAAETSLVVAARIDGVTSGGAAGDLVNDGHLGLSALVAEGETVHIAEVDGAGHIRRANRAFGELLGGEPVGRSLAEVMGPDAAAALGANVASTTTTPFFLNIETPSGRRTLRAYCRAQPDGYVLVCEPPWAEERALEEHNAALQAELVVAARESARQARSLEEANRRLKEAHWHLERISEVLPMCVGCRAVQGADGKWQDVATFLTAHADFLSHGYCAVCASTALERLDDGTK